MKGRKKYKMIYQVPEYSWGGVLADTAVGAGTGALTGGPFGAIIGGAGALLKGAVGEISGNKEEKLAASKLRVDQANQGFNTMMTGDQQNPFTPTFAMGGQVGGVNAEIEKGETAMSPDGKMHKYSLPSHANAVGDNFKYFEPGTMIFSDKLKFNKGRTFAKEQSKYMKISDNAEKALKNPGSTFLNKRTAKLNKQNAIKMSQDLFGKQEAMKMSKGGKMKYGGKVPMAEGGYRIPYDLGYQGYGSFGYGGYGDRIQNMQIGAVPTYSNNAFAKQGAGGQGSSIVDPRSGLKSAGFNRSYLKGTNNLNNSNPIVPSLYQYGTTGNNPVTAASKDLVSGNLAKTPGVNVAGGNSVNWGGVGMQALSLAPDIYNLGQALFSKPEKISRDRYTNPYTSQIRSRMNNRRFNIDPMLAGNRNANAIFNRNASNASGGDRSRLMSNLLGGMNARQGADAAAYSQKINMDNQYMAEQAQMDFGLGQQNAQALYMSDDINARNTAAKRNFGASAASGMQRYALNNMQMKNQNASQQAYLDVLQRSNPFFNQWLGIDDLRNYNNRRR